MKKFKVGDKARIVSIENSRRYGIDPEMEEMYDERRVIEISYVYPDGHVRANGWIWSHKDLRLTKKFKRKSSKPVMFDERLLDI
jgi:hypothetical protein